MDKHGGWTKVTKVRKRDSRQILVRPVGRVRGKYSLRKLVARIPRGYRAGKISTGRPVGKEVW